MAEQDETDKYIKCSKCRCKYINDDEHIKIDFGHNRLNEQYKTCVKCRNKQRIYSNQEEIKDHKKEYGNTYRAEHKEQAAQYAKENKDRIRAREKQYRDKNKDVLRAQRSEKIVCDVCDKSVNRFTIQRHKRSIKCINHPRCEL